MTILYDPLYKKDSSSASQYADERELCMKYFEQWPEKDQVLFVENLLSRMCDYQQGQINSYLAPMLQRDFISLLTKKGLDHVAESILAYLDTESLRKAEQVNKEWKRVVANGLLWKKLIESKVLASPVWRGLAERKGWIRFLFNRETARSGSAHFSYRIFPMVYRDIERIESNWANGRFQLQRLDCQSEHSKGVYCLQYDNDKIVSGLRDNTIKIWDKTTLQCIRTVSGHTGSILCLQYNDKIIVSGSSDHTVRVWDISTGEMVNALFYHEEAVLHLRFVNGVLVTCSKDKTVAVWDMVSATDITLRRVLVGHRAAVNVVDLDDVYIVSASGDRTIKLWFTSSGEFVRTFNGHSRGIACLQYKDNLVVSGSSDLSIRLWNIYGNCLRMLEGHDSLVRCVRFDEKRIVSGDYNGKIKVWDLVAALKPDTLATSLCLQTFQKHTSRVFRIQFDQFQMVSSSHDDTILIWDFLNYNESTTDLENE